MFFLIVVSPVTAQNSRWVQYDFDLNGNSLYTTPENDLIVIYEEVDFQYGIGIIHHIGEAFPSSPLGDGPTGILIILISISY